MKTLIRAGILGTAYALATTAVELSFVTQKLMAMNMPPVTGVVLRATVLQVLLGVILGLIVAPLLRLAHGWLWHLLALAAVWTALERYLALDPAMLKGWLAPPLLALALVLAGRAVARWSRVLPWVVGAAVIAAVIAAPAVQQARRVAVEAPPAALGEPMADAPDVVLIVLDTVRAENMSAYGYARPTTPTFDALARDAVLFLDATSPSTWSLPSHASLFTGWFPSGHRAHSEHRVLGSALPTLAEVLMRAGYETRCFTANPHISDSFGLTRGFAWSDRAWAAGAGGRSFLFVYRLLDLLGFAIDDKGGGEVAANFERWAASRPADARPAFAFLNFLEAHFPYHQVPEVYLRRFSKDPPSELRAVSFELMGAQFGRALTPAEAAAVRPQARDMYDAGVLYSDHLLGRVVDVLEDAGRLDDTILVVLSDHGEMLGEHGGFGHGASVREHSLRVPLLVRYPPRTPAGLRIAEPVSTLGVYGTVLDLAGVAAPGPLHVGSLMPLLDGQPAGVPVIAERYRYEAAPPGGDTLGRADRRYRTYRSGTMKLVRTSTGETYMFDLAADPNETADLAPRRPAELAHLVAELGDWEAVLGLPAIDAPLDAEPAPVIDDVARQRLRALGYVE